MGKGAPEEWKEWGNILVLFSSTGSGQLQGQSCALPGQWLTAASQQQVSLLICFEGRSSCGRCLPDSPGDRKSGILARGPGEGTESQRMFENFGEERAQKQNPIDIRFQVLGSALGAHV